LAAFPGNLVTGEPSSAASSVKLTSPPSNLQRSAAFCGERGNPASCPKSGQAVVATKTNTLFYPVFATEKKASAVLCSAAFFSKLLANFSGGESI
jgi:hypothetical protein